MDFVTFEIAKKLKEKGFSCQYPIAMYNELGSFHALYTSADHNPNIKSVFGNREYYDYDDFDDKDCVCPTISQVLKWLREEKKILITIIPQEKNLGYDTLCFVVYKITEDLYQPIYNGTANTLVDSYEETAIAGIEYALNLI